MRATEFLIEYRRDVTKQNYGAMLLKAANNDPTYRRYSMMHKDDDNLKVEGLLELFEKSDPTRNKQYVQWIIRTYIKENGSFFIEDVMSTLHDYLKKFYELTLRRRIPSPRNDINKYQSFGDFLSVVDEYEDVLPQQIDKGNAIQLYDDAVLRAIIPNDRQAACYYGRGTRWCTSATNNNQFDFYSEHFPLVIVLPKQPTHVGEKYQLHFSVFDMNNDTPILDQDAYDELEYQHDKRPEYPKGIGLTKGKFEDSISADGQFMDENDNPVRLKSLTARFGKSFTNVVQSLLKYDPELDWVVDMNFTHN